MCLDDELWYLRQPDILWTFASQMANFSYAWRNWRTVIVISDFMRMEDRGVYICRFKTAYLAFEGSLVCVNDSDVGRWS